MDLFKLGQELLGDKLGDSGNLMDALSDLTGGEGIDLGAIVEKLSEGGLGEQVGSWLGDGDNAPVSADDLTNALGADKIGDLASRLGIDSGAAAASLSHMLPGVLDKLSSGGSLLDSLTSGESPMDLAKKFLGQ